MMKIRKRLLCLTLSAALLVSLTGCGKDKSTARTMKWLVTGTEYQAVYQQLADNYMSQNEGLTIEVSCVDEKNYYTTWVDTQKGEAPADLFTVLPGGEFTQFAESGLVEKISPKKIVPKEYDENLFQFGSDGKDSYAVAITGETPLIFYDAQLFRKVGVEAPSTIADVVVVSQFLQSNGNVPMKISITNGTWDVMDLAEGVIINGPADSSLIADGTMFAESGILMFKKTDDLDSGFIDLIGFFIASASAGTINFDTATAPQSHEALLQQFLEGQFAMMLGTSEEIVQMADRISENQIGFFSVPGTYTNYGGVWKANMMLGIAKDTKVEEDAKGFITYLLSEEGQKTLCDATYSLTSVENITPDGAIASQLNSMMHNYNGYALSIFQRVNEDEFKVCKTYINKMVGASRYDIDTTIKRFKQDLEAAKAE